MTTVVRGATLIAMPKPSTTKRAKKLFQYEPPIPGIANIGKARGCDQRTDDQGQLGTVTGYSPPDERERKNINRIRGSAAAPASVAE